MSDRLAEIEQRIPDAWIQNDIDWLIGEVKRLRQENLTLQHQRIYGAEMAYDLPPTKAS